MILELIFHCVRFAVTIFFLANKSREFCSYVKLFQKIETLSGELNSEMDYLWPVQKKRRVYIEDDSDEEETNNTIDLTQSAILDTPAKSKLFSSTPIQTAVNSDAGDSIESKLEAKWNGVVKRHARALKEIRKIERQNNNEFLSVLSLQLTGEQIDVCNVQTEAVMFQNKNLMALKAGADPGLFGRLLGKEIFGNKSECLLKYQMIGRERNYGNSRQPVDKELERIFEKVVKLKYPQQPEYAYSEARKGANDMGNDFRRRFHNASNE